MLTHPNCWIGSFVFTIRRIFATNSGALVFPLTLGFWQVPVDDGSLKIISKDLSRHSQICFTLMVASHFSVKQVILDPICIGLSFVRIFTSLTGFKLPYNSYYKLWAQWEPQAERDLEVPQNIFGYDKVSVESPYHMPWAAVLVRAWKSREVQIWRPTWTTFSKCQNFVKKCLLLFIYSK